MTESPTQIRDQRELEAAVQNLSEISRDLRSSYENLEQRARAVEEELCRTNATLEAKIAELDAVNAHLEAILGSLPTGVIVRDASGRIVKVNRATLDLLGYAEDELLGLDTIPELDTVAQPDGEREIQARDGRRRVIASRVSAVPRADGPRSILSAGARSAASAGPQAARDSEGSVEILDDRTEVSRMSQRIHQLDKMAALGTMAGGIAHELRNPMNAVLGFASLLKRSLTHGGKEARWAERICDGVFEVDAIITSLLTFADPERLRPETVQAGALLDEVAAIVSRDLAEELQRIDLHLVADDVEFTADRVMLRQAIRNLTANAIQAQPEGGSVEVRVSLEEGDVVIQVTDEGPGITPDQARRVTDPFYTTRAEGTGLGLPLVHTVAELHGGSLEIVPDPAPPVGARITLRIPKTSDK